MQHCPAMTREGWWGMAGRWLLVATRRPNQQQRARHKTAPVGNQFAAFVSGRCTLNHLRGNIAYFEGIGGAGFNSVHCVGKL